MVELGVAKLIHLVGIFMLFLSLGGLVLHGINGGTRQHRGRYLAAVTHGVGMVLVLIGGFGMLARLQTAWPWPWWVLAKLGIWLVFGGMLAAILRRPAFGKFYWWLLLVFGAGAAYLGGMKPM